MGLLRRGEELRVTSSQDTAGGHVPLQIPFTSRGGQIVVDHGSGTGSRVQNPVVSHINGYVIDRGTPAGEQQQISRLERCNIDRE